MFFKIFVFILIILLIPISGGKSDLIINGDVVDERNLKTVKRALNVLKRKKKLYFYNCYQYYLYLHRYGTFLFTNETPMMNVKKYPKILIVKNLEEAKKIAKNGELLTEDLSNVNFEKILHKIVSGLAVKKNSTVLTNASMPIMRKCLEKIYKKVHVDTHKKYDLFWNNF